MENFFIYCDYLLDMKGGVPFIKEKMGLEIEGSKIRKVFNWGSKEKWKEKTSSKLLGHLKKSRNLENGRRLDLTTEDEKSLDSYLYSRVNLEDFLDTSGRGNKKILYFKDHLIMPGLINSHTHLPMSLFRGFGENLPFHRWLFDCILPVEKKMLNPDFVRIGTELSALECIDQGITTVFDMYSYAESIAEVFEDYGLRGFFGEDINNTRLNIWEDLMESFCNRYLKHDRIQPALAPHAPYTCENDLLKKVLQYQIKKGIPIFIHVSETKKEVEDSFKKYGLSPIERLHQLGLKGRNSLFVHTVWLSAKDVEILKNTKTSVSYNPASNMKLGSGIAPIHQLIKEGVNVCLGTDGAASNNDLNLFDEMDVGLKLQKLRQGLGELKLEKGQSILNSGLFKRGDTKGKAKNQKEEGSDDRVVSSEDMLKMVTTNGALALNLTKAIGSLEEGKFADLVALHLGEASFYPRGDFFSNLVFSGSRIQVNLVLCHGKILKFRENRLVGRSKEVIFEEVQKLRKKMNQTFKDHQTQVET